MKCKYLSDAVDSNIVVQIRTLCSYICFHNLTDRKKKKKTRAASEEQRKRMEEEQVKCIEFERFCYKKLFPKVPNDIV